MVSRGIRLMPVAQRVTRSTTKELKRSIPTEDEVFARAYKIPRTSSDEPRRDERHRCARTPPPFIKEEPEVKSVQQQHSSTRILPQVIKNETEVCEEVNPVQQRHTRILPVVLKNETEVCEENTGRSDNQPILDTTETENESMNITNSNNSEFQNQPEALDIVKIINTPSRQENLISGFQDQSIICSKCHTFETDKKQLETQFDEMDDEIYNLKEQLRSNSDEAAKKIFELQAENQRLCENNKILEDKLHYKKSYIEELENRIYSLSHQEKKRKELEEKNKSLEKQLLLMKSTIETEQTQKNLTIRDLEQRNQALVGKEKKQMISKENNMKLGMIKMDYLPNSSDMMTSMFSYLHDPLFYT